MFTKDAIRFSMNLAEQSVMRSIGTMKDAPLTLPVQLRTSIVASTCCPSLRPSIIADPLIRRFEYFHHTDTRRTTLA